MPISSPKFKETNQSINNNLLRAKASLKDDIYSNESHLFQFFEASKPSSIEKTEEGVSVNPLKQTLTEVHQEFETLSSQELSPNNAEDVLLKSTALLNILDNLPKPILAKQNAFYNVDRLYIQIQTLAFNASDVHNSGEEKYRKIVQSKKLTDSSPARLKYQAMLDSFSSQKTLSPQDSAPETKGTLSSSNASLPADCPWKIISTSGADNNCGIFSLYPSINAEQATEKRNQLVSYLILAHEKNEFTDNDYHNMQANLRRARNLPEINVHDVNQRQSLHSIFQDYLEGILSGTFLDPFALQLLANKDNKHIIFVLKTDIQAQSRTLEQIWEHDHAGDEKVYDLENIIFIAHNGSNHFERIEEK